MGRRLWSSFSSFSWCLHDGRDVLLSTALLYGSLSLFVSLLHNVFLLFYVETFVSVYKIDKVSFWVGETVFLLWNSLNDPLLGWLSDRAFLSSAPQGGGGGGSPPEVVLRRLRALSRNGPLLALSFLSLWVAWAPPGLQFLLCLCAYDGFLTAVDLNHAALLADLAVTHRDRMRLNFHCSLFSALGSASVFLSYVFWDKENLGWFRVLCVALASASALGFLGASRLLQRRFHKEARLQRHTEAQLLRELAVGQPSGDTQRSEVTLGQYLRQLSNNKNFLWFVSMNLVQVFHCHFNSNFFPLFLEHLLSDSISASTGSILLGVSYIAPHLNNMYFLTLCQRYGVYQVIRWLFVLKLGLSVAMMLAGADHTFLLCVFIASNRVFTEGTCKLLNLVISDLVDEDLVLNRRPQAASALLFGMVALGTKPGQTLAPLIGTWLLCAYTGYDIFERNDPVKAAAAALAPAPPPAVLSGPLGGAPPPLRLGCFYMLVCVPITCALLQLAAWQRFTLHGRRLHLVKTQRTSQQQQGAPELPGDAQGEGGDAATTHLLDVKAV